MPAPAPQLDAFAQRFGKSLLQQVHDPTLQRCRIELWIKRDDLLHPVISGNKWRKLKYVLDHALSLPVDTFVSMGGAYSNHLHALAYVGKYLGLKTAAFVRGERPACLNPTLRDLLDWGMELRFVPRSEYRLLRQYTAWNSLPGSTASTYWLPEGGATALALRGVGEILQELDREYDVLCAPCGTGTTLAGLIAAAEASIAVQGFAALKGGAFLQQEVAALLPADQQRPCRWSVNADYHFGGFAKTNAALHAFIQAFASNTGIALEPVYTGKMLYGIYDLARQGYFPAGTRIIALHTGGLQGNRGFVHAETVGTGIDGAGGASKSLCGSGF